MRTALKRSRIRPTKKTRQRRSAVKQLDQACRERVFERDRYTCQRCGKKEGDINEHGEPIILQWSHVHSRRHPCLRWEDDNSKVLCLGCHHWWGMNPGQAFYWFSTRWPERWENIGRILQVNPKVNPRLLAKELHGVH
jgi:5-methylcytosine-specific restriction endonuclease McrA